MLNDEQLMNRGAEAEAAKPYVAAVISHAKNLMLDRIVNLNPDQTLLFTVFRSQILCLDDVMAVIESDINEGRLAISRLQGDDTGNAGIL